MKKKTVKLLLVVSLLSSIALADDDMGNGTRLCGDMGNGTCRISLVNEKEPIVIKDENKENSTNIVIEWFNDILVEIFN